MSRWDPFRNTPNHLINRAARLMARLGEPRLRALGVSVAHLPVLSLLEHGDALPQKDLARGARIEQPTMAELLARMKRDGLVRVTANPADRRSQLVSLTKLAATRLPLVRNLLLRANREVMAGFTRDEIETLTSLLGRVVANLEAIAAAESESIER